MNAFFCTNIFPGEDLATLRHALDTHIPKIRAHLGMNPTDPFPLGLRLSAQAANELLQASSGDDALDSFRAWLDKRHMIVRAMNGFPYGAFHGERVKENVFLPDWTSPERLHYTENLFRILDALAPEGSSLSVSTLPASHKSFHRHREDIIRALRLMGERLDHFTQETGRDAHLDLEPEPFGYIENTDETIALLRDIADIPGSKGDTLRRTLGLTYDTCHFALQFENAYQSLTALHNAGIRVGRIQASNALALDHPDADTLGALAHFDEPVYFHQTSILLPDGDSRHSPLHSISNQQLSDKTQYGLLRFPDLNDALAWGRERLHSGLPLGNTWRCHFHIPVGTPPVAPFSDTSAHLIHALDYVRDHPNRIEHIEVETYTWTVLPPHLQRAIDIQIADELAWVNTRL